MGATFPTPVLAVAAEAIRDLEGRDALSGLWTLFTKCKESLQDGRRLENISWRLWYREIMLTNLQRERDNEHGNFDDLTLENEKANDHETPCDSVTETAFYLLQPPTDPATLPRNPPPYSPPFNVGNAPPPQMNPFEPLGSSPGLSSSPAPFASSSRTPSPRLSPTIPAQNRRPSTSRSRRSSFLNGTNGTPPLSVGKIIYDMLPSTSSTNTGESNNPPVTAFFIPRPALSHKSTSSTIVSGEEIDNKSEANLTLTKSASPIHDPIISQTLFEPSLSPTSPMLSVAEGVRSNKLSLTDLPTVSIIGNGVSSLPTPEPQESEPNHNIIVGNSPSRAVPPHLSSSIPSLSIPSDLIPSVDTSVSLSNNPDGISKHDPESSFDSVQPVTISAYTYTGPPSPSLSDSYACAHPAEVAVKELGLLPSVSISHDLPSGPESLQPQQTVNMGGGQLNGNTTPPASSATSIAPSSQRPEPPTLVVVNPTPNLTPNPTPPATPLIHGSIGPGGLIKSQWLALPEGATGSRQHQLLQAAQLHMGPQVANVLRLPPAFIGGVGVGNGGTNNVVSTTTMQLQAATTGLDRSRSDGTAVRAESHFEVSPENANGAIIEHKRSSSSSLSSSEDQLQHQSQHHSQHQHQNQHQNQNQNQHSKDSPKRLSISSTTSSRRSQTSASDSSISGHAESTSTTNTSASEYDHSDDTSGRLKSSRAASSEQPAAAATTTTTTMFEVLPAGMAMALQHGPKRLNSFSTIQSMSTFTDRKKDHVKDLNGLRNSDSDADPAAAAASRVSLVVGIANIPNGDGDDKEMIMERKEEEDRATPLSPLPLSDFTTTTSPKSDKRRKRNSAPTLPTLSPSRLSPTGYGSSSQQQQHVSSPKSATSTTSGIHTRQNNTSVTTTTTTTKRKQITAGGAGRNPSRSRSVGGSSVGKSRSRSRDAGGVVVGLGGFGMTQVAPPSAATGVAPSAHAHAGPVVARKAPMVAGGRGRAKVVLGRTGMKAKGMLRRNSSGTTAIRSDNARSEVELEKEKEKEKERAERERAEMEAERGEREYQERMKIEAVGKGRQRSLLEEEEIAAAEAEEQQRIMHEELVLAAIREREAEEAEEEMARRRAAAAQQQQQQQQPAAGFRLGSNSDGVGSKSAGSSSGLSPARRKFKGKGKRRDGSQQSRPDHPKELAPQFLEQNARQLSKPQMRQLQMMEQLLAHQMTQMIVQRPQPAHERQLTPSGQQVPERESIKSGPEPSSTSRKGKNRDSEPVVSEGKRASKSSGGKANANPLLAPNLEKHLASPLLPQNRRKIVLATSESDFETDSDDDGSWSSEEMTGDEEDPLAREEEQLRQEQLHQQLLLQQQVQQQQLQQKQLQQQQIQQQRQRQQQHQQHQVQHHHHQQPTRPTGVQRTQSSHYPAPNNTRNGKQSSRAQQRHQNQVNAQAILDAAAEAQRQREMFVKLPTSSFQNLANARAKSVGLLTQLMNPNPEIFPPNHPYRRGFSTTEIKPSQGGVPPLRPLTSITPAENNNGADHPPIPEERAEKQDGQQGKSSAPAAHHPPLSASRTHFSPPSRPGGLNRTKSAAAIPVSSHFTIGSMGSKVLPVIDHTSAMPAPAVVTSSAGKIRLGPPPADAELEDDSDDEGDPPGGISKSLAHEKLKALARNARIPANQRPPPPAAGPSEKCTEVATAQATTSQATTSSRTATAQATTSQATTSQAVAAPGNADDNAVPNWVVSQPQGSRQQHQQQHQQHQHQPQPQLQQQQQQQSQHQPQHQPQQQHTRTRSNPQQRSSVQFADAPESSSRAHQPPAPIPVGYPYNLPISAIPSTPRTTRRQMLSTELPESLRRNLLWERQVSNGNLPAMRRSTSGGGGRHNVLGGLQPLTAAPVGPPPMVELRPRRPAPAQLTNGNGQHVESGPSNTNTNTNNAQPTQPVDPDSIEAQRRRAMARNKSWATNYHGAGW